MTAMAERPAVTAPAAQDKQSPIPSEPGPDFLRPRRWTRAEYYRLGEAGFFEDERVELLDGEIWTLPPQKTPHFSAIRLTADVLEDVFGAGFELRQQAPMTLDDGTEPEPDVLIVPGSSRDYEDHHPASSEALLLVEVSDSTLTKDRGKKAADYARAGITDYWIVNLVSRQLEVHRDPGLLPDGYGYKSRQVLLEGDVVSPLLAPGRAVAVSDLFPRKIVPLP